MKSLPPEYLPCFELENIDVCVRDYMKVERASTIQLLVFEAIWDENFHRTFCVLHAAASVRSCDLEETWYCTSLTGIKNIQL